jgi:hypothetical protein
MTPEQVGLLTYREFSTMMEVYNDQKKNEYEMQRNVMLNALINANRKKHSRVIPLFKENNEKTTNEILAEREELFGDLA